MLLIAEELGNLWSDPVDADIIPGTDDTYDLGSATKRFAEVRSNKIFAVSGEGTHTLSKSGFIGGKTQDALGTIEVSGEGAFAAGFVRSKEFYDYVAKIKATADGAFAQGVAKIGYDYYSSIRATAEGAFAQGRSLDKDIVASGIGSFARGNGNVLASGKSSFAQGNGSNYLVKASGRGSFAFGDCYISYGVYGDIHATAVNSIQFGVGVNAIVNSLQMGGGVSLRGSGPIFMKELAAALSDIAGWGQLWVKNTTPCELWFTRDNGTEVLVA